jgi:hypothetical protein
MKSIVESGMEWLWSHKPDIALVGVVLACAIWITSTVNSFEHRLAETERVCNVMTERQLPELRIEIKEMKETELREIKEDIVEIKLILKRIDTYLSITSEKYPSK